MDGSSGPALSGSCRESVVVAGSPKPGGETYVGHGFENDKKSLANPDPGTKMSIETGRDQAGFGTQMAL